MDIDKEIQVEVAMDIPTANPQKPCSVQQHCLKDITIPRCKVTVKGNNFDEQST